MSASHARLEEIDYAVLAGDPAGKGEDRVFTAMNAVIVLDGATQPTNTGRTGGWFAEVLGQEIRDRLGWWKADLRAVVGASIAAVRDRHDLRRESSPSATVAIARWDGELVEALVLGDSSVILLDSRGEISTLRDQRLSQVASHERKLLRAASGDDERRVARQALTQAERAARNMPGGYWIAEADPRAAWHALYGRWSRSALDALLVVTDGVSAGVDVYGSPPSWSVAVDLARRDPAALVNVVHEAEESDPDRVRWARSKRHDDKAAAIIRLQQGG